ncbi:MULTISPECIES: hypothetical protein [unclassified Nocardioides]|uniref:hypothetical protein n=1 Tax=unclassified Nocardioides TaxID=2615069 RepID=UPI003620F16B
MATPSRALAGALLTLGLLAALLTVVPDPAEAAPKEKVKICHRTNSRTNPYNQLNDAEEAVVEGHAGHTGPIFGPDVEKWGDILPPIEPGLPDGLNWTAEGREILDNGCEMPPDPGPMPGASIADATCTGTTPSVEVTVSNAADATDPATFTIRVNGADVQTVGPIAPGDSTTVTLAGVPENQVAAVEVLSDGEVIASRVVTADCSPGPPPVSIQAALDCVEQAAQATLQVTNNGVAPLSVVLQVDGEQIGDPVAVAPGATESRTIDASRWEDQAVTAQLLVDGVVVATYTVTPDCQPPVPRPAARVSGLECPPERVTVVLGNDGDPDSTVVFFIRVDDRPVRRSAPLYGGDTTTIVADLTRLSGRTVHVQAGYNDRVVVNRPITIPCAAEADSGMAGGGEDAGGDGGTDSGNGNGTQGGVATGEGALPSVGSPVPIGIAVLGGCLLAAGAALLLLSRRRL